MTDHDLSSMRIALAEAQAAGAAGEVPVGAVILDPASGEVIARAGNRPIALNDPTGHAEILVLRAAAAKLGNYRLPGLTLVVTLEPCAMCAGAISLARIGRLVFGAGDPKGGAVIHGPRWFDQPTCHWRPQLTGGILERESAMLLTAFFRERRHRHTDDGIAAAPPVPAAEQVSRALPLPTSRDKAQPWRDLKT